MRYKVRQRILSFRDNYDIKDETGAPRFRVVGSFLTIADKLELIDLKTGKVVNIKQKLFRLFAEYHFIVNGETIAVFKQQFKVFGSKFEITAANGDSYQTRGGVIDYNFKIASGNQVVAAISKKIIALTDSYNVDIPDELDDDHVLIMAAVIAIDQVVHDNDDGTESTNRMLLNARRTRRSRR